MHQSSRDLLFSIHSTLHGRDALRHQLLCLGGSDRKREREGERVVS